MFQLICECDKGNPLISRKIIEKFNSFQLFRWIELWCQSVRYWDHLYQIYLIVCIRKKYSRLRLNWIWKIVKNSWFINRLISLPKTEKNLAKTNEKSQKLEENPGKYSISNAEDDVILFGCLSLKLGYWLKIPSNYQIAHIDRFTQKLTQTRYFLWLRGKKVRKIMNTC